MELNWDDLKYFYMVSRHGTLIEAAERLGVNHSTVFRRIISLESDLGVKLFDRTHTGYQLSNIGQEVYNQAVQIVDTISDIGLLVDNCNNELQGIINLTAPQNFAYRYLPNIIYTFQKKYPDISINLIVTNKYCDLSKREADLAVRASPSPPEYLIGVKLFSFCWSVYASKTYIDKHGYPNNEAELADHRIISVHQDMEVLPVSRWIKDNIPKINIVSCCNDLMSMSALVEEGVGLAILPDDQNRSSLVKLFEVDFGENTDIWILSHPNMRNCLRLKTFKKHLIDQLNNHPDLLANILSNDAAPTA